MTEITQPEPYAVESAAEIRMRHDFMEARSIGERITRDPESYDPADELDIRDYSNPWLGGAQQWTNEWMYLSEATDRWREDPEFAARSLTARQAALSPIEVRSEEQARHIAEHGFQRGDDGWSTSPYVSRVWERVTEDHRLATAPVSTLDGYDTAPTWGEGNVLDVWGATSARDGMEW
ncbi:hypothetical protein ACWEKT_07335 [Nocardia takedensis]